MNGWWRRTPGRYLTIGAAMVALIVNLFSGIVLASSPADAAFAICSAAGIQADDEATAHPNDQPARPDQSCIDHCLSCLSSGAGPWLLPALAADRIFPQSARDGAIGRFQRSGHEARFLNGLRGRAPPAA